MMSVQSRLPGGLGEVYEAYGGAATRDVNELLRPGGDYAVPNYLGTELNGIKSGIGHINLDNQFLKSSKDWGVRFDPATLQREKQAAIESTNRASDVLRDVKSRTNAGSMASLQPNQQKENLHHSVQNVQGVRQEINPFVHASADRIRQFCDRMGVTDRYTGYRHNLNRGQRDPRNLGGQWSAPTRTSPARVTFAQSYSAPIDHSYDRVKAGPTACIQEQCGINMTFPGKSEYSHRYVQNADPRVTGFQINPSPNFYMHGRNLMHLHPPRSNTEYQTRYGWPDGKLIPKRPWLRK